MGQIKSHEDNLILNADGDNKIIFHNNGAKVGSIDSEGYKDEYDILIRASLYPVNELQTLGNVSGTINLDCSRYDTFMFTVTAPVDNVNLNNFTDGRIIGIVLTNAGSDVTWPSQIKWAEGTEPIFSAVGTDRIVIQRLSSSIYHGSLAGVLYA